MTKETSNDFLNYAKIGFYVVLTAMVTMFIINYGFIDWEEVTIQFDDSVKELVNSVRCEIDYKDFHYKGFCQDQELIFNFLANETQYCKVVPYG